MIGRYISDLDAGDVMEPIEFPVTPLVVREYCHGVEEDHEWFHSARTPYGRQVAPPTLAHVGKNRLLDKNCPGGSGPHARMHYEYHAVNHGPIFVGDKLLFTGRITERYLKRGRTFIEYELEARTSDGRLVATYHDKTLLSYKKEGGDA